MAAAAVSTLGARHLLGVLGHPGPLSAATAGSLSPSLSAWFAEERPPQPGSPSGTHRRSVPWPTAGRVTAELVVRDDPRPIRRAGRPGDAAGAGGAGPAHRPGRPTHRAPVRVLVLATDPAWRGLLPGQRLTADGRLGAPRGGDLTAAVLSAAARRSGTAPSWAQRAAGTLRAGLQRACAPLPDDPGGLLPGLVVGDTSRLPPAVEEDFRATGMTHLNAVSGSQRGDRAWAWCCCWPAGRGPGRGWPPGSAGWPWSASSSWPGPRRAWYGPPPWARSGWSRWRRRPRAALPALAAAVAVLVLVDPELAGDAGFALSVLATGGLLLLAPGWRDGLRRRGVPAGLAEALAVPAAAQLACGPVVAGHLRHGEPGRGAGEPAGGAGHRAGHRARGGGGGGVAGLAGRRRVRRLAGAAGRPGGWSSSRRYGARLPAGTLPWPGGVPGALLLAGLTVALLMAIRRRSCAGWWRWSASPACSARCRYGCSPPAGRRRAGWSWPAPSARATPSCCRSAPGRAVVVDAGPEPEAVDRCLRRLGVREVRAAGGQPLPRRPRRRGGRGVPGSAGGCRCSRRRGPSRRAGGTAVRAAADGGAPHC